MKHNNVNLIIIFFIPQILEFIGNEQSTANEVLIVAYDPKTNFRPSIYSYTNIVTLL